MQKILDEILLSDEVVNNFYEKYEREDFKDYLLCVIPEVEACRKQEQDNPWHIYNCLEHILHSVEEINKLSMGLDGATRRILSYTMFLHDMGKPKCHKRRYSTFFSREVDSFWAHNEESVKIAKRILPIFNFDNAEQEIIKLLIHEHDIFLNLTLDNDHNPHKSRLTLDLMHSLIQKYNAVGDGKTLLKYLIMIGRADNLAQNPQFTSPPLHLLDVMEEMLKTL